MTSEALAQEVAGFEIKTKGPILGMSALGGGADVTIPTPNVSQ